MVFTRREFVAWLGAAGIIRPQPVRPIRPLGPLKKPRTAMARRTGVDAHAYGLTVLLTNPPVVYVDATPILYADGTPVRYVL